MNVYDFDKTIYKGDSTLDFFWFCLRRYPRIIMIFPRFIFTAILYSLGKCTKEKMKESFYRFLHLLPDTEFEVKEFWKKNEERLCAWYLSQKQDTDIIISASPTFLLSPICRKLNVSLIASKVDIKTGMHTGLNCYGKEKV